ncbi:hypothetical protein GO001_12045 [Streptomyces sp. NRRL B-1677]|uniref:hypothetical protein n=1 Tax=Streptomyces sp. NRRL B-1677 TaxID=2682966 RepID=UPI001892B2F2|nr:hypothetical protein [Streptomyces sp. NRRL B-1677]MBF6045951.1 hypothetical protein [Streptomyces sp. NRRL B-1677]
MPEPTTQPGPATITLMAAGHLRDALSAHARGDLPTAVSALMSIDPQSWQAIEHRLALLGGATADLLHSIRGVRP